MKEYNDSELAYLVEEDSQEAKDILFEKYKYIIDVLINKYARIVKILGIDFADLYQEAYLGFTDAIITYNENNNTQLKTFISLCVERKIQTALKKAGRIKNKVLNESVSLEHQYDNLSQPLMYLLGDEDKNNPLKKIVENEKVEELINNIQKELSDNEYEVYSLLITGLSYQEIATILDKEPKQIDNTIQRIRIKVKKIIK